MGSVGAGSGNFGLLGQQNSARWEIFGSANGKILRVLGISAAPGILRTAGFAESTCSRGSANAEILRTIAPLSSGFASGGILAGFARKFRLRERQNFAGSGNFGGSGGSANGQIRGIGGFLKSAVFRCFANLAIL